MFSTVCLDTSCYSTWNYFSQGNCHITHKVPIEQQHCSSSTEPGQCTHKRRIIFIFGYCQNHGCLVNTIRNCFWAVLIFFCLFVFFFGCSFGTTPVYLVGQDSALGKFSDCMDFANYFKK